MSVKPCKFYDLTSGKPVLIGGYDEALQFLVDNPEFMEMKAAPKAMADIAIDYFEGLLGELGDNVVGLNAEIYRKAIQGIIAAIKLGKSIDQAIRAAIKEMVDAGENKTEVEAKMAEVQAGFERKAEEAELERKKGIEPSRLVAVETEGEIRERKTITSIRNATDISDETKAAFHPDRINYKVLPNKISAQESKALIDAMGLDEAQKLVLNPNSDIPGAFRTTMAQMLIKAYNKAGRIKDAVDIAEGIAEIVTDWAQGIQALSMFEFLTPEGQLMYAKRDNAKQRDKKFAQHDTQIKKGLKAVKDANEEAINETLDKLADKVEDIAPTVKRPSSYGEKNTIVTKSLYEKAKAALRRFAFSGVSPDLVIVAAYHMEAGARSFADFSKRMIEDFGRKVKPHLRGAYKAAQTQLGGTGYSTDKEIADYFAGQVENDIKAIMRENGLNINDIIRSHYTVADAAKQTLTDKLIEKAGLSPQDAAIIAKAVETEFNKLATEKKLKAFAKMYGPFKKRFPKIKTLQDKLIELSNMGAFTDDAFRDAYAQAMGFPELSEADAKKIVELAEKVQNAKEGLFKKRAVEDLLKFQAQIKGIDWFDVGVAIHLSALLSGPTTQLKNIVNNSLTLLVMIPILAGRIALRNPKALPMFFKSIYQGFVRGELEAEATLMTGYSPIKNKAQIPGILERIKFWGKSNPYNAYKYVSRVMTAADVLTFMPTQEIKAWQYAVTNSKTMDEALALFGRNDDSIILARVESQQEYDDTVAKAKADSEKKISELVNPTKAQIDKIYFDEHDIIDQAKNDMKRRFYEIMDEKRNVDVKDVAHNFAEKMTFTNPPTGVLGVGAQAVNSVIKKMPEARYIAKFVNVVTNVANMLIDFTPVGAVRAARGGSARFGDIGMTKDEKVDNYIKATLGTSVGIMAYILSQPSDDDDDEPIIQITANGYNNYAKNKDLEASGWKPMSIKIGDRWISYQYTPFVLLLASVGALRDWERYKKQKVDEQTLDKWSFAFGSALQTAVKTSGYIESTAGFLQSTLDANSTAEVGPNVASWLTKTGTTMAPIVGTNLYSQFFDKMEEAMGMPEKEVNQKFWGKLAQHMPVAQDYLQNKVNGLGEELPKNTDFMVFDSNSKYPELWEIITKHNQIVTPKPINGITYVDDNNVEHGVTPEQYYQYAKTRGEYIRTEMEDRYFNPVLSKKGAVIVKPLVEMDSKEFERWLNGVKKRASAAGKATIK
jgi:hypothetical protein